MFAIVKVGGKQYRADEGAEIVVDRIDAPEGTSMELASILVSGSDGVQIAAGEEDAAPVEARVVEHFRGEKVEVFKFKPKRGYKRKTGYRSALTRLAIEKIG